MAILLTVLSILCKVLLIAVGLIVILVLLLLLVPATYKVELSTAGGIRASGNAKVMAGAVRAVFDFSDGALNWDLKALFFSLKKLFAKKDEKKEEQIVIPEKRAPSIMPGEKANPQAVKEAKKEARTEARRKKKGLDDEPHFVDEEPKPGLFEKIRLTLISVYDKIKKAQDIASLLKEIRKQIMNILHQLLPKKIKGRVVFGFEDPSVTGRILAVAGALYPVIPRELSLTPDFEEAVMDADVNVSGRISLLIVLINGIIIYRNKNVKKLLGK